MIGMSQTSSRDLPSAMISSRYLGLFFEWPLPPGIQTHSRPSAHYEVLGEVLEEQLGSKPRLVIRAADPKTSIDESSRRTSKVAQQWDQVIKELKKDRHSLAATIYGEASVESVDEETVHLGYSKGQSLYVTMARKPENKRELSKALEIVTGERLSIEAAISSDLP